jgi:hypothetical protein
MLPFSTTTLDVVVVVVVVPEHQVPDAGAVVSQFCVTDEAADEWAGPPTCGPHQQFVLLSPACAVIDVSSLGHYHHFEFCHDHYDCHYCHPGQRRVHLFSKSLTFVSSSVPCS